MPALAFTPDYAIPPGATLRETFAAQGITQSEAASSLGLTVSQVRALLNGRRELDSKIAGRLETLTRVPAFFWNQAQSNYALRKMRLVRTSLRIRPRRSDECRKHRGLLSQTASSSAKHLRDCSESRVPIIMGAIECRKMN